MNVLGRKNCSCGRNRLIIRHPELQNLRIRTHLIICVAVVLVLEYAATVDAVRIMMSLYTTMVRVVGDLGHGIGHVREIARRPWLPIADCQIRALLVILIDTYRVLQALLLVCIVDVDVLLLLAYYGLLTAVHVSRRRDSTKSES